jgi:alkylation response protein AidB-like acyl-CoA dehydrogenase
VPSEYGGLDVSNSVLAEVTAILSAGRWLDRPDPTKPLLHILEALRVDGTEEQKRFFFGRALAGDRFGNALSERGTKTVGHYNTRLTRDGFGYRLNGRKFYSTGAIFADWVAVFALDEDEHLTMSFVQRGTDGIKIIDDWDGFGQRTTGSGTTVLDNVYVQADAVVLHHKGFERPTTIGSVGQIIHAGIDLGIARAAFADTIDFVKTRSRPWTNSGVDKATDDPLTIAKVGEIAIRLEAATALVDRAGLKVDIAQIDTTEENVIAATLAVAAAKVLTSEIALDAANALFELAGTTRPAPASIWTGTGEMRAPTHCTTRSAGNTTSSETTTSMERHRPEAARSDRRARKPEEAPLHHTAAGLSRSGGPRFNYRG